MAQASGSHFKLVFSHWYHYNNESFPISNGLHPATVNWIKRVEDPKFCRQHLRHPFLDHRFQTSDLGYFYRHGNFIWHFCRVHSEQNLLTEEQVIDDGSVYYFPIEVEWSGLHILSNTRSFNIDGNIYEYQFSSTLTSRMLKLLQLGKVKLLITNLIDASAIQGQIRDFEKIVNNLGIDSSNVIFAQGNKLNFSYEENPVCKIKLTSGMLSLYQAAEQFQRYPFFSQELNYTNDIVRPIDLDVTKHRNKRFLCFNRSMNRAHRLAMAYLALKYNLLADSTFSFVTNLNSRRHMIEEFSTIYPNENISTIVDQITELVPYELDTQHFAEEKKQGFQTIGINKKEWYETSYIHIVSESSFDESIDPFFSEKTWRPIMNMQPFLFVGNCNSLAKLKKLGFKTFHPYIDESYDLEKNPRNRFLMIEEEIKKLSNRSMQELHDWYYSITDILTHNWNHLQTFSDYDPWEELYK
jgi:hypothetical protein